MSSVEYARIREIWNHVHEKKGTSDVVWQFLKPRNEWMNEESWMRGQQTCPLYNTFYNNSWTRRGTTYGPYVRVDIANIACVVGIGKGREWGFLERLAPKIPFSIPFECPPRSLSRTVNNKKRKTWWRVKNWRLPFGVDWFQISLLARRFAM